MIDALTVEDELIIQESLPLHSRAFFVYTDNKINSILNIALICLDVTELEILRDCLIDRTPKKHEDN